MKKTFQQFHGGIIDNFLAATERHAKELHNFWIDESGKIYTRDGLKAFSSRCTVTTTSERISGIYLGSTPYLRPVVFRGDSAYHVQASDLFNEITGPASNAAIPNKTDSYTESAIIWRKQVIYGSGPNTVLPHRIYCSAFSTNPTFNCLTLGLPQVDDDYDDMSITLTADKAGAGFSYLYAFVHVYSFTDYDSYTFEEQGPVAYSSAVTATAAIAAGGDDDVEIESIPTLANTTSTNYDVDNVEIYIYRTQNNGSTFYYIGKVDNGTDTFTDNIPDATSVLNDTLYTEGGVLENEQPPIGSLFVTEVNGFFFWATETLVTQSKQGAPGHCPDEYYWYTDRKIKGLGRTLSFPILFTDGPIYRLEGTYYEFGDGGFEFREISATVGCVSHKSIVRVPGGLVWAGNNGFYFTDGYDVQLISAGIPVRYNSWKNSAICGAYDSLNEFVHWTISGIDNDEFSANNLLTTLHLDFGWENGFGVFSTWGESGNYYPTALAFEVSSDIPNEWRNRIVMGEERGYLLYQDANTFVDPKIDETKYPIEFQKNTIIYRYESIGHSLDDDSSRKYCTELVGSFEINTELSAQFITRRDDGSVWGTFSEMRTDGPIIWGVTNWWAWDDDKLDESNNLKVISRWNSHPILEGKRHFPRGTLRAYRRQIGLTNSFTYIAKSDDYATATIETTNNTATLASGAWPDDCDGYYLYFSDDSYDTGFKIKERVSDTVVEMFDPLGGLSAGSSLGWEMKGYRKHEKVNLLSYSIFFDGGDETLAPNRGVSNYRNA
jgi:hypothetical protein